MVYGIRETGGSADFNVFIGNSIKDFTTAAIVRMGANTVVPQVPRIVQTVTTTTTLVHSATIWFSSGLAVPLRYRPQLGTPAGTASRTFIQLIE